MLNIPMSRSIEHYERKIPYSANLPPRVAKWLTDYGDGSLSVGILEAVRQLTNVDVLYPLELVRAFPRRAVARSHEERKQWADERAQYVLAHGHVDFVNAPPPMQSRASAAAPETDDERRERIKRNTRTALDAQAEVHRERAAERAKEAEQAKERQTAADRREFAQNVKAYMDLNQAAYDEGAPLQDHVFLLAGNESDLRVYEEVLKRSKAKFGWSKGPKPADVSAPHYRAAGAPQAAPVSKAARDPLEPPGGRVTVDYSDVFDAPLPRREPDPESLERETAVRANEGGEPEPIAAEVKPLSTAVQNSTADPGAIGPDETPEPSF